MYDIMKDIIVPVLSPLVAVLTLIFVAKQERKKIDSQRNHELQSAVNAAEREVFLMRESYEKIGLKIVSSEEVEPERIASFDESRERFFKQFHESPSLYEEYFSKNKPKLKLDRMTLLFAELEIKLKQVLTSTSIDNVILFALYILLYARKDEGDDQEEIDILNMIYESSPDFYKAWWEPVI